MRNVLLALFALGCGIAADKAVDWNVAPPAEVGYSQHERHAMDELTGMVIKQAAPKDDIVVYHRDKKSEMKQKQAQVLAMVYHVTPRNLNDALFGKRGR